MGAASPHRTTAGQLAALYRTVSELLLNPSERDAGRVARRLAGLDGPAAMVEPVRAFMAAPRSTDLDEYVAVLELTPPCPLYLGAYIHQEPQSCRGAGVSGRNGYMLELAGTYRHFGVEIGGGELADFLPAIVEFLAYSLEHSDRDGIGLRRRFVEKQVRPGLGPMREALAKYDSPYALLIAALEAAVAEDIAVHAEIPMWAEPARIGAPPRAPIISFHSRGRRVAGAGGVA
ncbi:MAG: hypothetical protein KIS96_00160 [Bauldia sp.]|nr:hypothetical protein [Bauldia sp.]